MAPLPLLKIFGLVIKTLSKPLTNRLKKEAKKFKNFSNLCVSIGQFTHQFSSRATALASGFRVKEINPLPEEDALARGISFVSETFLFVVGGGIIVIEFYRSEEKNALKAEDTRKKEEQFRLYLEERFSVVDKRVQHLEERIAQLEAEKHKSILPSILFPESYSSKKGLSKKNPYSTNPNSQKEEPKNEENQPIYESVWRWGAKFFAEKDEKQKQSASNSTTTPDKQEETSAAPASSLSASSPSSSNTTTTSTTQEVSNKYVEAAKDIASPAIGIVDKSTSHSSHNKR